MIGKAERAAPYFTFLSIIVNHSVCGNVGLVVHDTPTMVDVVIGSDVSSRGQAALLLALCQVRAINSL